MRAVRASDRSRDRAAARLREACAGGAIGIDTFETRLALALRARTVHELRSLVGDLPTPLDRVLERLPARRAPAPARLAPPEGAQTALLGRSRQCDVVLETDTVSRRHAVLRREPRGWRVIDLESTNGTYVNGVRVHEAPIAPGDQIRLGALTLTFAP